MPIKQNVNAKKQIDVSKDSPIVVTKRGLTAN